MPNGTRGGAQRPAGRGAAAGGGHTGGPGRGQGGGRHHGGGAGGGQGDGFEVATLPQSTQELVEHARREKFVVHPALELSKFVEWQQTQRKLEPNRRRAYGYVIDCLKGSATLAQSWRRRRKAWLEALGKRARVIEVEALSPCVLWLAAPTPLELGFCLHHTYGLPYLPGSALKGLARKAMLREELGVPVVVPDDEPEKKGASTTDKVDELFGAGGHDGRVGKVDFLDGIPLDASCLELEVMSPHHPKYYQGESKVPHDCEDPIPLPFLRIKPTSRFEIALFARTDTEVEKYLDQAERYLLRGLEELGVGAKTSSGYGLFKLALASPAKEHARPSASDETTAGEPARVVERRTIAGATIDSFDIAKDLVVFTDEQGNLFHASIKECEQRFGFNRSGLNQLRTRKVRFEIHVEGTTVVAAYKKRE
ncbi:MAG: type III-B CRISPR module RAMP protein Cmr6 [Candidatus Binatia bacterium]|nr:type III-B CRISPR module RAMP protein Cmr6 [Candidatus Binatia bacterium]